MNDIITVYVKGDTRNLSYNPMYKFKNIDEFIYRVETKTDIPDETETVTEGYRGDNLICVNEFFKDFVEKVRLIAGID